MPITDLLGASRHAMDSQPVTKTEVRMNQNTDRGRACGLRHDAGCGSRAAFELVTDHAGAAADIAFLDGARSSVLDGGQHIRLAHALSVDGVQHAIIGLCDDRHAPNAILAELARTAPDHP